MLDLIAERFNQLDGLNYFVFETTWIHLVFNIQIEVPLLFDDLMVHKILLLISWNSGVQKLSQTIVLDFPTLIKTMHYRWCYIPSALYSKIILTSAKFRIAALM